MREETSAILRLPFPAEDIDQLPRVYHRGKPDERTVLLDYVGHAAATARLLDADIAWTWEPFATDGDGLPRIVRRGDAWELWIRLTVDGTTRPGVGTVPVEFDRQSGAELPADETAAKELIGDAIRNAAMRFGVALDLWRKHDSGTAAAPAPAGPPCPHCGAPVTFTEDAARHRPGKKDLPFWSCTNRTGCGGGGLRDKSDPSKGNYSWASYDADFFADRETGGELIVVPLSGPGAPPPPADAFNDLTVNLTVLGITSEQAEAELQAYRDNSGFASGHVKDMRANVNRACVLLVATGREPEGVQAELWKEWTEADPARKGLAWGAVRGGEVQQFAAHVQAYLRLTIK